MAYDFRANQIRTEKLIVSAALGQHRMLVYPVGVATDLQGTVGFNVSEVGTDTLFFVSGAKGGKGGATPTISLFGGDLVVSGNLVLLAGISGSLQRLDSGIPYMLAGPSITIVTNSLGQIEISSSVVASDPNPWKESGGTQIQTTSSVAVTSNALFFASNAGSDIFFYVSGSTTKKSVFGGDMVISGAAVFKTGLSGSLQRLSSGIPFILGNSNITVVTNSLGQVEISSSATVLDPNPWKESGGIQVQTTSSVAVTGTALFFATNAGSDIFFYVSGSSTKKAVFGDELIVSGNTRVLGKFAAGSDSYFSGSVTTAGTLISSGNFIAVGGLSGSLQRLSDGSPAFIAGDNIAVVTQSNGAIAISGSFSRQSLIDLLYPSQSISLSSSTGWTDVSFGGGSVSIASGSLIGTIPGSTAAGIVAAATIPWTWDTTFEIRARVTIVGDTTASAKGHLRIRYGADGFFAVPSGDGSLSLIRTLGGYASLASTTGRPVDGTGWIRMRIVGQRVTLWYGTGSGSTEPTSWTLLYDADQASLISVASPTTLHLGGQYESGGGLSVTTTFAWSSVTIRTLSGVS